MGFKRFIERILERSDRAGATAEERRVAGILDRGRRGDRPEELRDALLAALPAGAGLEDATVARIAVALRGLRREGVDGLGVEPALVDFWRTLRQRFPDRAYVAACYGDELLRDDQGGAAVVELLAAFELDPGLFPEFGDELAPVAERLGSEPWLRYRLAGLRARLEADSIDDDDFDGVREEYSELLEDHAGDEAAVRSIRELGRRIDELTAADRLPRAIVRRGDWRSKPR